jgi:hypothetical protein
MNKKKEEEMLKKLLLISLVCIGVMAILVPQVDAGCCCKPRMCCPCISGSLICFAKYLQVFGSDGCDELGNCPVITVNLFGIPEEEEGSMLEDAEPTLDPDLGVPGMVCCANPGVGSVKNPKKTPEEVTEGKPFRWPSTIGGSASADCDQKNNCRATVTIDPTSVENPCVNPNWDPLGWTPGDTEPPYDKDVPVYRKQVIMCPGAYDETGACCATPSRVYDEDKELDICGSDNEALERIMIEDCTMNLTEWNCSDEIQEDCTVIWSFIP